MPDTLEDLQTTAQRAHERYAKAQAAAEAAAQQAAEQERQRLANIDRAFLDGYSDEVEAQRVQDARRELLGAAAADPVWSALARVYAAQLRRATMRAEAGTAAMRLGDPRPLGADRPASAPEPETLARIIADLGEQMHGQFLAEWEAAREPQQD